MKIRLGALLLIVFCLVALPVWPQASATGGQSASRNISSAPPLIRKLEPPDWWVNYTPDLTLLLTGENLGGASVESSTSGIVIKNTNTSANGRSNARFAGRGRSDCQRGRSGGSGGDRSVNFR